MRNRWSWKCSCELELTVLTVSSGLTSTNNLQQKLSLTCTETQNSVLADLLFSEATLVTLLTELCNTYARTVVADGLLDQATRDLLFGNCEELLAMHTRLLARFTNEQTVDGVCEAFRAVDTQLLLLHVAFAKTYVNSRILIRDAVWLRKQRAFRTMLDRVSHEHGGNPKHNPLFFLLHAPSLYGLAKYEGILRALLHATPANSSDRALLERTVESMEKNARFVKEAEEQADLHARGAEQQRQYER